MSTIRLLPILVLSGLASTAVAQIPGDTYFVVPGLGSTAGFAYSALGATNSIINGATEQVGTVLQAPNPVINSTDTLVNLGGGHYVLTLKIDSTGDLCPLGYTVGGATANNAAFFMGANAGADPVNFNRVALVNSATIAILDAAGAVIGGPFNITAFANFSSLGGGWNGSLGVSFGAGSAGGIYGYELVVDYNEGDLLGTFTTSGTGCGTTPIALTTDVRPSIGALMTLKSAAQDPATLAVTMVVGFPPGQSIPLPGAPGCTVLINNVVSTIPMALSLPNATLPLTIPNNPALIGSSMNFQSASLVPGANSANVLLSNLGTARVGR